MKIIEPILFLHILSFTIFDVNKNIECEFAQFFGCQLAHFERLLKHNCEKDADNPWGAIAGKISGNFMAFELNNIP